MDDLAFLRERIESYAGYTNGVERRLADEQIRAYVGEALARLPARLQPSGPASETLARLLLRCEFVDQRVAVVFDADEVSAAEVAATSTADRELVTLAERADTLDAADLGTYLAQIDAAFDRRWPTATTTAAVHPTPPVH